MLGTAAEAENAEATFGYEGSSVGEKVKLRPEIMFRTQKVSFNCSLEIIPRDQMTNGGHIGTSLVGTVR